MLRNVVCLGRYLSYVCVGRGSNWKCCRSELYITFYFIFIILSSVINHNVARDITSSLFLVDSPVTQVTYHLGGGGEKCSTCPRFILVCCQLPMPTFSDTLNFHHMNELISILFFPIVCWHQDRSSREAWRHEGINHAGASVRVSGSNSIQLFLHFFSTSSLKWGRLF